MVYIIFKININNKLITNSSGRISQTAVVRIGDEECLKLDDGPAAVDPPVLYNRTSCEGLEVSSSSEE